MTAAPKPRRARAAATTMLYLTWQHLVGLFILAIPIACVARTVVFEEIFREPRDYCVKKSKVCRGLFARKFFYLFTCEYCFSHYVTIGFLILTALGPGPGFKLLYNDWRGYLIAFFALVMVANFYLNLYSRLRVDITSEKKEIEVKDREIRKLEAEVGNGANGHDGTPDESARPR